MKADFEIYIDFNLAKRLPRYLSISLMQGKNLSKWKIDKKIRLLFG